MIPYAQEAHDFFRQPGKFDEDVTLHLFNHLPKAYCWVIDEYRAALFSTILPIPFTKDYMGHSLFWYYRPDYQPGSEFVDLLHFFIKRSKNEGAQYVELVHWEHLNKKIPGLMKRLGFEYSRSNYVKAL